MLVKDLLKLMHEELVSIWKGQDLIEKGFCEDIKSLDCEILEIMNGEEEIEIVIK